MKHHETADLLLAQLPVAPNAAYETVASLDIGPVAAGSVVQVYGESHGNPRQDGQTENAWVTGISAREGVDWKYHPCWFRGRDLEKNRKHDDARTGAFTTTEDHANLTLEYRMRAVNLTAGGTLDITWVKLGAVVHPAQSTPPEDPPDDPPDAAAELAALKAKLFELSQ